MGTNEKQSGAGDYSPIVELPSALKKFQFTFGTLFWTSYSAGHACKPHMNHWQL